MDNLWNTASDKTGLIVDSPGQKLIRVDGTQLQEAAFPAAPSLINPGEKLFTYIHLATLLADLRQNSPSLIGNDDTWWEMQSEYPIDDPDKEPDEQRIQFLATDNPRFSIEKDTYAEWKVVFDDSSTGGDYYTFLYHPDSLQTDYYGTYTQEVGRIRSSNDFDGSGWTWRVAGGNAREQGFHPEGPWYFRESVDEAGRGTQLIAQIRCTYTELGAWTPDWK